MSIDTNKWTVLQNLNQDFVANMKLAYIFGNSGKQVIIITKDDNVYSYGDNINNSCLGLGHRNPVAEPTLIEELCQKRVIDIQFSVSYHFVLALTENGNVYQWGSWSYNLQRGDISTQLKNKPEICDTIANEKVINIKAGFMHSIALTISGEAFVWGYHFGSEPQKFQLHTHQKIISISSGSDHWLAITESGDVYMNDKQSIIMKHLDEFDEIAIKIACGTNHSLILSNGGNIYCIGRNRYGQCGDGTNDIKVRPTKVDINAKFIDIAATKHYSISVGLTDKGFCYIWGKCGQHSLNTPMAIPSNNNMYELIEYFSTNRVTYQPIHFKNDEDSLIFDRISDKFDKREYSDIAFKVADKCIYAQKAHLINVCKHFEVMFSSNNWAESNKNEIEINDYSYSVYYAFIKFLYTDSIEVNDEESIELLDLANCYLDEKLKKRCVEIIKKSVKNENVIEIYYASVKNNSKDLNNCCIEHFHNNFADKTQVKAILDNAVKFIEK